MSITDELREWALHINENSHLGHLTDVGKQGLRNIADRIDAAHRAALEKLAAQVEESERIGFDQGFASADDWLAQNEDAMAEHGWVRLPVDADGVPIHIGDVLTHGTVVCIRLTTKGWEIVVSYNGGSGMFNPSAMHHHAPTVEDVLREFTDAILEWAEKSGSVAEIGTWSDVAAEYAAKLRLAGEDV